MWLSWPRPSSWHSCFVCGRYEAQILTTEMWSRNATTHPWCSVIWMMNNQMKKQEETENWREWGEGGKKKWKEKITVSSSSGILKIQNCTLSETLLTHLLNNFEVPVPELTMEKFPLFRWNTRVQSCQSPQYHNLITKGGACMLWCVTIAVYIAVLPAAMARATVMQCHLRVEPPHQNLK